MTASNRCQQCGAANSPDTRFCVQCGATFVPAAEPTFAREDPTTTFTSGFATRAEPSGPSSGAIAAIVVGALVALAAATLGILLLVGVIGPGSGDQTSTSTDSPRPSSTPSLTAATASDEPPTPTQEPSSSPTASPDDYARLFALIPNHYGPCEEETDPNFQEDNAIVTARCEPSEGIRTAWFDLFEAREDMDALIGQIAEDFGSPSGTDCEIGPSFATWHYDDTPDVESGEILCFLDDDGNAWLYWTEWDNNLMGSMYRRTPQFKPLFDFWQR